MDKDLLRIVIIAIGVTVIIGMVLWSNIKNKKATRKIDFYDKGNPLENIDESLVLNTDHDDFDVVPIGSALDTGLEPDPITVAASQPEGVQKETQRRKPELPKIIQFSIVAVADEGFNGKTLINAFQQVGLEYGSMRVFERLDAQKRVDFAVASMVEPGTFPDENLELFSSPGIVFFFQPYEMDNPLAVFDDFITTINLLAFELDGAKWDHNRQPLTDETVQQFRMGLRN